MIVHLVPGTVLEARYTAYLNANRKDLVRKKKMKIKFLKRKRGNMERIPRSEAILGTGRGQTLKSTGINIYNPNNRKKTKSMSANISKYISNETIIPILQLKPVLKRNKPKLIIFPTLGVKGRLILSRKITWCLIQICS